MTFFTLSHRHCAEGKHHWLMLVFNKNTCMSSLEGCYGEAGAVDIIFHLSVEELVSLFKIL